MKRNTHNVSCRFGNRATAACGALVLAGLAACETHDVSYKMYERHDAVRRELVTVEQRWLSKGLSVAVSEPKDVEVKFAGTKLIDATFGPDPITDAAGSSYLIDAGKGWKLMSGYVYLTGYWRLLELERTRTITWGTTVVARIAADGTYGSTYLPERDQIFVLEGTVLVSPLGTSDSPSIIVSEGEYAWAYTDDDGKVVLEGPATIPDYGDTSPPDADEIAEFLEKVEAET